MSGKFPSCSCFAYIKTESEEFDLTTHLLTRFYTPYLTASSMSLEQVEVLSSLVVSEPPNVLPDQSVSTPSRKIPTLS